jgi:hypothetical protein
MERLPDIASGRRSGKEDAVHVVVFPVHSSVQGILLIFI